jgi:hypothetical protein
MKVARRTGRAKRWTENIKETENSESANRSLRGPTKMPYEIGVPRVKISANPPITASNQL